MLGTERKLEIIKEYGKSYQRAEDIKDNWRQTLEYSPAREEFLINKSKLFLHLFPTSRTINCS